MMAGSATCTKPKMILPQGWKRSAITSLVQPSFRNWNYSTPPRFGGSREAALVRLLSLGLTNTSFYRSRRDAFLKVYAEQRQQQKGFAPPHQVALSSAGPTFTGLVIESFNRERITASDVSDYLQIRLKHLAEVQRDYARIAV